MATKSVVKTVDITSKKLANGFIKALENAQDKHSKDVEFSRTVKTLRKDEVKAFFGEE
jgi:hypothetical protein